MDKNGNNKVPSSKLAGKLLSTEAPTIEESATIGQVETMLLSSQRKFETIDYIYVIDAENKLRGVISIKELFRLPKTTKVSEVMTPNPFSVRYNTHRERVAETAIKHSLKAVPVVDQESRFLGTVPSHVILNILHQENTEDFLHSVGVRGLPTAAKELLAASSFEYYKKRLPWLVVGMFGGIAAALVVSFFERVIAEVILLAAFIPMVVYIADAVGSQAQTIFIRSLSLENFEISKYVARETRTSLLLAGTLAALIFFFIVIWWNSVSLAVILSLSFLVTIIMATGVAVFLPWMFNRRGYDPAIVSGPFATVIRDILSIVIYFGIANLVIAFV